MLVVSTDASCLDHRVISGSSQLLVAHRHRERNATIPYLYTAAGTCRKAGSVLAVSEAEFPRGL